LAPQKNSPERLDRQVNTAGSAGEFLTRGNSE